MGTAAPYLYDENPLRDSVQTPGFVDEISFRLADPPVAGSGIDDAFTKVWLSTSSQFGGAPIQVWFNGGSLEPTLPTQVYPSPTDITEREGRILMTADYLGGEDTVTVRVLMRDNNGNETDTTYTFSMSAALDESAPVITWVSPECATEDVDPNVPVVLDITDAGSGVDLMSIQVYVQEGSDPEIQVLQDGHTSLANYYVTVVAITNGYRVTVHRPSADPLWPACEQVCIRVEACDTAGGYATYPGTRQGISS